MFNNFLNAFLSSFYASFQKRENSNNNNQSKSITKVIRNSCKTKRELILLSRLSNDVNLKTYYKQYGRILANVIKAAKKLHYNRIISNSENKMKRTWRKPKCNCGIQSLMPDNKLIRNQKEIAGTFNTYFITIANSILVNNNKHSANIVNPTTQSQSQSHIATDSQSVSLSWCHTPSGAYDQNLFNYFGFKTVTVLSSGRPL
jgi:hypothetical protein